MAETVTTDDVEATAKASAEAATKKRRQTKDPKTRKMAQGRAAKFVESDVPYPAEAHGEDFEEYGPMGYAAKVGDYDVAAYSFEQEFMLDEEMLKNLPFQAPGRPIPAKGLYTIKAIKPNGVLSQLPFEPQIQNTAGGEIEDAIGLRRYQRKGYLILMDFQTLQPVYCAAAECWAKAKPGGFCTDAHRQITMPSESKESKGMLEAGVTTSRIWGS